MSWFGRWCPLFRNAPEKRRPKDGESYWITLPPGPVLARLEAIARSIQSTHVWRSGVAPEVFLDSVRSSFQWHLTKVREDRSLPDRYPVIVTFRDGTTQDRMAALTADTIARVTVSHDGHANIGLTLHHDIDWSS